MAEFVGAMRLPEAGEVQAIQFAVAIWDTFLEPLGRPVKTPEDPGYDAWFAEEIARIDTLEKRLIAGEDLHTAGVVRLSRFMVCDDKLRTAFLDYLMERSPDG